LDAKGIKLLCAIHLDRRRTVADIIGVLKETSEWEEEWGGQVFELISVYNHEVAAS
jgi:hypothetical protein